MLILFLELISFLSVVRYRKNNHRRGDIIIFKRGSRKADQKSWLSQDLRVPLSRVAAAQRAGVL
jgi:hypothetical protein